MTDALATVAGSMVQRLELRVPQSGVWVCDAVFGEPISVSGSVVVTLGSLTLRGTVVDAYSGAFGASRAVRIAGGAGGWAKLLPERSYHNDAGVKAALVARDAAQECGETIGDFAPADPRVGVDYLRPARAASATLANVLGGTFGVPWWVDYAGVTHAGVRAPTEITGSYSLLTFAPSNRVAVVSVDDPATLSVGSVLRDRLASPQTIRELVYHVEPGSFRVECWCGGSDESSNRLASALAASVRAYTEGSRFGVYRYRVLAMAASRVDLQAASKAAGMPDALCVPMRPGAPGMWADLAPGCEVLVQFVAGDTADPVITGFAPLGDPSSVPVETRIGGTDPVACLGDGTVTYLPTGAILTGVLAGSPPLNGAVTLTITLPTTLVGNIQSASRYLKVKR